MNPGIYLQDPFSSSRSGPAPAGGTMEVLGARQPACLWPRLVLDKRVNESIGQSGRCLRPEIPGLEFEVCQEAVGGVQNYLLLPCVLPRWLCVLVGY